jgi:hypothetical protein
VEIPSLWEFALLALAAFRVWRLIAEDTIFDGPRHWLVGLGYRWADGDPLPKRYREHWGIFLQCAWCAGFWISLLWWVAWLVWPHATVVLAVPWAISAVVALVAKNLDKPEE